MNSKSINRLKIVASKEIKELWGSKRSLLISLFFAGWFGFIYSRNMAQIGLSMDALLFLLSIVMAAFLSFLLSAQIFLREKMEKTIIDLLCSPLSLQEVWLGKTLGVFVFAYAFNIIAILVVIIGSYYQTKTLVLPSAFMILHILINVPLFTIFAIGINGLIQLLLGIKENRIAYFATYLVVFGIAFVGTRFTGVNYDLSWMVALIAFVALCILVWIEFRVARWCSKERIITRID